MRNVSPTLLPTMCYNKRQQYSGHCANCWTLRNTSFPKLDVRVIRHENFISIRLFQKRWHLRVINFKGSNSPALSIINFKGSNSSALTVINYKGSHSPALSINYKGSNSPALTVINHKGSHSPALSIINFKGSYNLALSKAPTCCASSALKAPKELGSLYGLLRARARASWRGKLCADMLRDIACTGS